MTSPKPKSHRINAILIAAHLLLLGLTDASSLNAAETQTANANNIQAAPKPLPDSDVFVAGKGGYHTYRIPAIVMTNKGTLLAFCEGRKSSRGDAGNIDMLVSRSTNQGKTWSDPIVIWDDQNNTCGNPAPVVDQSTGVIWLPLTWNLGSDHEGHIKAGTSKHPRLEYMTHSKDDGLTWSKPKQISDQVRKDHWRWYATGPCNSIQLKRGKYKGRLLIPANHSDHSDKTKHPYRSHVFWSDDHGKTWTLGGVHEDRTNESAVVELADGSILQSMRSYHGKHNRAFATSSDGGKTWSKVHLENTIKTPNMHSITSKTPSNPLKTPNTHSKHPTGKIGRAHV